jgi:hypothetical protein
MTDQMTKEEELAWIQESTKEATEMDLKKVDESVEMQKLLAAPEITDSGVYKYGDAEIRHRKFMPSKLRSLLSKGKKEIEATQDIGKLDSVVYQSLAALCMDDPYTNPVFWAAVDLKTSDGRVYKIFQELTAKIGGTEAAAKTFR